MNTPGTEEGNWQWRFDADALTPELARPGYATLDGAQRPRLDGVPGEGVEPPRPKGTPGFKPGASTSSATPARRDEVLLRAHAGLGERERDPFRAVAAVRVAEGLERLLASRAS